MKLQLDFGAAAKVLLQTFALNFLMQSTKKRLRMCKKLTAAQTVFQPHNPESEEIFSIALVDREK